MTDTERCDHMLPDSCGYVVEGLEAERYPMCELKNNHAGAHMIKLQGYSGRTLYYEWEYEKECPEPEECEDQISCDHFVIWKVGIRKAKKRLKKEGPGG